MVSCSRLASCDGNCSSWLKNMKPLRINSKLEFQDRYTERGRHLKILHRVKRQCHHNSKAHTPAATLSVHFSVPSSREGMQTATEALV